jgi:hypothetical protein
MEVIETVVVHGIVIKAKCSLLIFEYGYKHSIYLCNAWHPRYLWIMCYLYVTESKSYVILIN